MIIEYDKNEKEVKRYDKFSARKIKALYKKYGTDPVNKFLDHLNMYGEARLRPLDPAQDDNGVLFKEVIEGATEGGGSSGTNGAPGNSGTGSGLSTGNSATAAA